MTKKSTPSTIFKSVSMVENIRQDIERRGMTHTEYAELLGVDRSAVSKWLSGRRRPSYQVLILMKMDTEELIKLKDKK